MAKLTTTTISKRTVEALRVAKDTVFWDSELSGFGVRVYPSGSKHYVVQTRAGGKAAKRVTVGRHGVVTAEEARRRAALVIARIKAGEEPVPEPPSRAHAEGPTVGEIARQWLDEHVAVRCKPNTVRMYTLIVDVHLLPAFGKVPALALDHATVTEFHHSLRATPVMANHAVDTLSRMWNAAEDRGVLPEASNPCRLVAKNRERRRERFLSEEEFRRLGRTLAETETCKGVSLHAVAAIRLLLLTGCRKSEILTLRWQDVDLEARELKLADSKTGARTVPISPEAADVLANVPRVEGSPWVIPGRVKSKPMRNLHDPWNRVCKRAGIKNARIHDCRHSFASRALALGEGLPMIGALLGHADVTTTARYAHLAQRSVRDSAVRVSDSIAADILRDWRGGGCADAGKG